MRGNAAEKIDWLQNEWIPSGPPVCVLSGFSGTGKTAVCDQIIEWSEIPSVYIPVDREMILDDLVLTMAGELENAGLPEMADGTDSDMLVSLLSTRATPQLIVIDDFDHLIESKTGLPPARLIQFIKGLTRTNSTKFRMLLVVDRIVPEDIWEMDQIITTVLSAPGHDEACEWLKEALVRENLDSELSQRELAGVAQWLGGNFSAMASFVQCLRYESVDDLILLDPEGWELREQVVSPKLIRSLERKFVDKTISRLEPNSKSLLEFLSIYRRPFRADAIQRLAPEIVDIKDAREDLISRFLLDRRRNWYSINSVIRELCTKSINANGRRRLFAQNNAADHYVRHFKNVNPNQSLVNHSMEFVEARFHLWYAKRIDEFESVAGNFRRQVIRSLGPQPRLPQKPNERLQLLAMINGALAGQNTGFVVLRGILAKLLLERNLKDDDRLALRHLRIAVQSSRDPEIWKTYVELTAKLDSARTAETVARNGFATMNQKSHAYLYDSVSEAYRQEGNVSEAIRFLDEGLGRLDSAAQVYLAPALGRLLCRSNRSREAIERLVEIHRQTAANPGSGNFYWRPIEQALFIALAQRDSDALGRIRASIVPSDVSESLGVLATCLTNELSGRYQTAAEEARAHSIRAPQQSPALVGQEAFSWLCCGAVNEAEAAISRIALPNNPASAWLRACIFYSAGRLDSCRELVNILERREVDLSENDIPGFLLMAWNDVGRYGNAHPSFYFPILPASLTGLERDLHRPVGTEASIGGIDPRIVQFPRRIDTSAQTDGQYEVRPSHNPLIAIQIGDKVSEYRVNQAGAVGDGSMANNPIFIQGYSDLTSDDLSRLAVELRELRTAMAGQAQTNEEFASLAQIEAAIESADRQDAGETKSRLASAGSWAAGVAGSIGGGLALEALKAALGLG